ncbi:MAG: adaptor protein MecA [Clostridia bacterium]|nr:adaptor protein MecA [Clostridia bacterium]
MKIERVEGNRRIRVLLTQNDLTEMNINIGTLTSDSPELHSFLFKVMDFIKEETGFNANSGQIMVEASPADGGVILTVTRILPERKVRKVSPKNVRVKKKTGTERLYRFADFEVISAYLCEADSEYLSKMKLFECGDTFFIAAASTDRRISEFAQALPPIGTNTVFLSEHGRLIAEGEGLVFMAEEIKKLK